MSLVGYHETLFMVAMRIHLFAVNTGCITNRGFPITHIVMSRVADTISHDDISVVTLYLHFTAFIIMWETKWG